MLAFALKSKWAISKRKIKAYREENNSLRIVLSGIEWKQIRVVGG